MKICRKKSAICTGILVLFFSNFYHGRAQSNTLFSIGEEIIDMAKSDNVDNMVELLDGELDLDKKAQIMESFLVIRTQIFTLVKKEQIQLFNVLKENNNIYIILFDGQKFATIKNKINNNNKLIDRFTLVSGQFSKTLAQGKKIYKMRCYSCHGKFAQGGIGPNLTDSYWTYVNNAQDLFDIVNVGKKGTMMLSFKNYLKPDEMKNVLIYIKALQNRKQQKPKKPEGEKKKIKLSVFN